MNAAVICEDPSRKMPIGKIVQGVKEVALLKSQRVVSLLPYDLELPRLANTGYVQQHYGDGWLFDRNSGERGCPMMLHVTTTCRYIYWAARLEPVDSSKAWNCKMRLVHSADNQRGLGRGMNQIAYVDCQPVLDERGGATIYGKTGLNPVDEGLLFTDLYSVSSQVRVKWLAITQHYLDTRAD